MISIRRVCLAFPLRFLFALGLTLAAFAPANADEEVEDDAQYQSVVVADPYLELHTGPGRSYPVFYIAERGETVEIIRRHTDWFEIRIPRQKRGWVERTQLESTLGAETNFRDYLKRRFEFGISYGRLEGDTMLSGFVGYRLHDHLLAEVTFGQSAGSFSDSTLLYVSLVSQPFPDARWSPFFAIGMGEFENTPKATLVGARRVKADLANAGVGLRYYISRQFFLRGDYRRHVALIDVDRTDTYSEWALGAAFFF